jgi:hypothetical protein
MILQRFFITVLVDIFQYLDDDARVAVAVEVDFLVIGDLANLTIEVFVSIRSLWLGKTPLLEHGTLRVCVDDANTRRGMWGACQDEKELTMRRRSWRGGRG